MSMMRISFQQRVLAHEVFFRSISFVVMISPENQWLEDGYPVIVPFYGTFVRFQGCLLLMHSCSML